MAAESHLISSSLDISYDKIVSDEIFGYTRTGNYKFAVLDPLVADGDTLRAELDALKDAYTTKGAVFASRVGGDDYTSGRVTSFNESVNRQNGDTEVTVTIVEKIKSTSSSVSTSFFKLLGAEAHLAESVSETYNYNRSGDSFSYQKSINLKFSSLANITDFQASMVTFKDLYKLDRKDLTTKIDGISDIALVSDNYDATFNESIDLENFSYELTENFQSGIIDTVNDCSISQSHTDTIDKEGYLQRVVTANLTSLRYDRNTKLKAAVKAITTKIINDNSPEFAVSGQDAKPILIEKGFTVDGKNAVITLTFSNRPEDIGGDVISYSCNKSESSGIVTYSLNISFKSTEGATNALKFANTITLYKSKQATLKTYVEGLFPEATNNLYISSNKVQFDKIKNIIVQDSLFDEEDLYFSGVGAGILKYQISAEMNNVETDNEEHRHSIEYDFGNEKDFFASNKLGKTTKGSATLNITFSDLAKDTVLTFLKTQTIFTELENALKDINETTMTVYSLESDRTSVSFTGYAASRTLSFDITE